MANHFQSVGILAVTMDNGLSLAITWLVSTTWPSICGQGGLGQAGADGGGNFGHSDRAGEMRFEPSGSVI